MFLIKTFLIFFLQSLKMEMVWTDVVCIFFFQLGTVVRLLFFFTENWYSRFGVINNKSYLYYVCSLNCFSIVAPNVYDNIINYCIFTCAVIIFRYVCKQNNIKKKTVPDNYASAKMACLHPSKMHIPKNSMLRYLTCHVIY